MRLVYLAAGRGSRLGPYTRVSPKCLTRVDGKSILDWLLLSAATLNISDIWLVAGYRHRLLNRRRYNVIVNTRWHRTSIVGSLRCAAQLFQPEGAIVSYTDILYTPQTLQAVILANGPIVVAYDPNWYTLWRSRFVDPFTDAESFRLDSGNNVIDIGRKRPIPDDVQGQYLGLLKITPEGWAAIATLATRLEPDVIDTLDMTALLSMIIIRRLCPIRAIPISGGWCEIDQPSDLPLAEVFARNTLRSVVAQNGE